MYSQQIFNNSVTRNQKSNFFETRMDNHDNIDIPDINCMAQFKRPQTRAAGVAIYKQLNDTANIISQMEVQFLKSTIFGFKSPIREICLAYCQSENGQTIVMVVIYKYLRINMWRI